MKRRAGERVLNVWSAACSTGQEPYSFVLLLRQHFPELSGWKVNVLATDLSGEVLAKAREGKYNQIEINRGLYMDERNYRRKPGFARLAADMTELIEHLGEVVRDCLSHAAKYRGLPGKPFESVHPRD